MAFECWKIAKERKKKTHKRCRKKEDCDCFNSEKKNALNNKKEVYSQDTRANCEQNRGSMGSSLTSKEEFLPLDIQSHEEGSQQEKEVDEILLIDLNSPSEEKISTWKDVEMVKVDRIDPTSDNDDDVDISFTKY